MKSDGREAIIFLDKARIFVYDGDGILKLDFPENIVFDLEITDRSAFDSLIDAFVKSKKLTPARVLIILSESVCFSRDIPATAKLEDEVRDFLEAVPFDQIISRRYKSQTGVRVIASNLELLEGIMEIFEREGFGIEGIVPAAIFAGFTTKKVLDLDFVKMISASRQIVRQSNMLSRTELPVPAAVVQTKEKSRLLPYLIITGVVLLVILVVLVILRR